MEDTKKRKTPPTENADTPNLVAPPPQQKPGSPSEKLDELGKGVGGALKGLFDK